MALVIAALLWLGVVPGAAQTPAPAEGTPRLTTRDREQALPLPTGLMGDQNGLGADGPEPPNLIIMTLQMLGALLLVIALMMLVAWLARKYMPAARRGQEGPDAISIQSIRSLGPRRSLIVIRVRGRNFLLGATPSAITRLADLDMPAGGEPDGQDPATFEAELALLTRQDRSR